MTLAGLYNDAIHLPLQYRSDMTTSRDPDCVSQYRVSRELVALHSDALA